MNWNLIGKSNGSLVTDGLIYDISDKPYMTCNEVANIIKYGVKQQIDKYDSFKDLIPEHILNKEQEIIKDFSIKYKFQDHEDTNIQQMNMTVDKYYSLSWISLTCHPRTADLDDNGRSTILITQLYGDMKEVDKRIRLSIHSEWYGMEIQSTMALAMLYLHDRLSCIIRAFMINHK